MNRIVVLTLACALGSCVSIDGGSVEVDWVVTSHDGRAINDCACTSPTIHRVRFRLTPVPERPDGGGDPCEGRAACEFACDRRTGATPFDIPPGQYAISLIPLGAAGQNLEAEGPRGVRTPAPILRNVVRGQPTQFDATPILADCAEACAGGNNEKVCTR